MNAVLDITNLDVTFVSRDTRVRAVRDLSLRLEENESIGILGESGAGKSTVGWAILGMIQKPNKVGGKILFEGENVLEMSRSQLRNFRWNSVSMIFQASMNTLDPVITVGQNFLELLKNKKLIREGDGRDLVRRSLERVDLPQSTMDAFPYQLSGGMKQRVVIAMALASNPKMLIADEPTTALDTITQRSILQLIKDLRKDGSIKDLFFISHDVTVHAFMTDRLVVMLRGRKIEEGRTRDVILHPLHPYTQLIMNSIRIDASKKNVKVRLSEEAAPEDACPYVPFCPYAMKACSESFPEPVSKGDGQTVYCYLYGGK